MKLKKLMIGAAAVVGMVSFTTSALAKDLEKVTFGTNWYAQAEHGGFYQAKATGIYEKYGLDVEIKMGGPQVNGMQLLVAGRVDMLMGYPMASINAVSEGLPVVTVAGVFQKDPQSIIAHPGIESLQEIADKKMPTYIATSAHTSFYPWLKAKYGFTDDMIRPYTFSVAPFLADKGIVQQGYVTSEPYAIEQGGVKPSVFLMADYGYPPYAETIETTQKMLKKDPELVKKFVQATMEGWASYFKDPAPGNKLIKEDNPEMTDEQLAFSIATLKEYGLVTGGDAAEKGIGVMTDERWNQLYTLMKDEGLLTKDINVKDVYTLDYLPAEPVLP
ncbi:MAG: nitrate ABC transporter substrate-binding protein [Oceanospirillaceae bacterium]|uniref:ABC transporter substrate-binding protein n=1 Tax=unclassified Thalassolituus TaxID=2624967 RepID=UPI000C5DF13E|nr:MULTISPECIES: ABC transporter substrate-binding protein [unclassified Thalassolituus]MBL34127.1 nitrate ABC transporter substrate-binding protein [Oceanospirillaceae bacterium]MBS55193.1 nitrate ABC transporter substrate-binding protein [Oceanospirillaceae bacterium]|tara:strand:- start:3334 stop:4326 length:993 start_codon:yes stop_codon:yes gene_type:complete